MRIRFFFIIALSVGLTLTSHAANNNWTDATGKWETGDNWSGGVPSSNDSADIINNATTKTVTIDSVTTTGPNAASITISNLTISAPNGTVNTLALTNAGAVTPLHIFNTLEMDSGSALQVSNSAVRVDGEYILNGIATLASGSVSVTNPFPSALYIGYSAFGQLTVSNGILQANVEFVGYGGGSSGTLTLAGGTNFIVGSGLNVSGVVNSTGTVWVTGGSLLLTNSADFNVGSTGVGSLSLSNGTVQAGQLVVGYNVGSVGTVTVFGGSFVATNASNTGSIDVRNGAFTMNGGSVAVDQLFVTNVASEFNLNGGTLLTKASYFSNGPYTVVGDLGNSATLMFQGTTHSLALGLRLGNSAGSTGTAWMTANQLVDSNSAAYISIGVLGVGQMTVSNGTWLGGLVAIGQVAGSSGTLTIAGGTNLLDWMLIGQAANATGAVWVTGGQLVATNGTARQIQVGGNSGVGQMTVSNGTVLSDQVLVGYFGGSQGTLTLIGGTTRLSSLLHVGFNLNSTGAVWVSGGQLVVTNNSMFIGEGGIGQMTVSNGTVLANDITLGSEGGTGNVVVAGGNFVVTNASNTGSIDVQRGTFTMNGGSVAVDQLLVTSVGGIFNFNGGILTPGSTTVSNGSDFVMGNGPTPATLNLTNGMHVFDNNLTVGETGSTANNLWMSGGQLIVTNSGRFLTIGDQSGSRGQVTVSNGIVRVADLSLGVVHAAGTLTLAGGACIIDGVTYVGGSSDSTGTVWITGGELDVTNSSSYIGYLSVGQMTLSNGTVRAKYQAVGSQSGGDGTLKLIGGTETVSSSLIIGDCASTAVGLVDVKGGDLYVTNASHSAVLDVRNGWLILTAGLLEVDKLVMTNTCGQFFHAGGTLMVGSTLLDPDLDADGDGLPNGWEQAHGLDPLSSIGNDGADGDPDGDGLSNMEEFELGTDPKDPSSPFHITTIHREGNDIRLTWETVNGKTNVVQATNGPAGGYSTNFVDVSPPIIVPGCFCVATTNYLDIGGATNRASRFYRIRIVP